MKFVVVSRFSILFLFILCLVSVEVFAQNNKVRISPKAMVKQTVGYTEVTVDFSRPGVKERKIWGGLVPYNKVWRAGANEATTIAFTDDVLINGNDVKAGRYGFFTIPGEDNWVLIFNKVADQWGAFEYNEAEDILRIEVAAEEGYWKEWLDYTITKTSKTTATVKLEWEKLKVPFEVEVSID